MDACCGAALLQPPTAAAALSCWYRVLADQWVRAAGKQARQKRRRGQQGGGEELQEQQQQQGAAAAGAGVGEDMFNPVQCAACDTEVGVRDSEGIYHFFNVVTSNA